MRYSFSNKGRSITRKITLRFLTALCAVIFFGIGSYIIYKTSIGNIKSDAYIINKSGQQRFLSQRIAAHSILLVSGGSFKRDSLLTELRNDIQLFEDGHNYLIHDPATPPHYRSNEMKGIYFNRPVLLDSLVHRFIYHSQALAIDSAKNFNLQNEHVLYIIHSSRQLLDALNLVVFQYQLESENEILNFNWLLTLVLLAKIILLILIGFIIFKPLLKMVHRSIDKIEEHEHELIELNSKLEMKVDERTRALKLINESLEFEIDMHRETARQLTILSNAIKQTDDSVLITDKDGKIVFVNEAFTRKTGFTEKEALGKKPSLVKSNQHTPEFYSELWETITQDRSYKNIFINQTKDGRLYWEEKTITPLKLNSDRITHFVATGKDITDRIKITSALEESEKKYRGLVEQMNEGVIYAGLDGKIMVTNGKFCDISGYTEKELYEMESFFILIPPEDHAGIRGKLADRAGGKPDSYEARMIRKDGKILWIWINSSPLISDDKISGVMATLTDITTTREAELATEEAHRFNEIVLETIPLGLQILSEHGEIIYVNKEFKKLAGKEVLGRRCWEVVRDNKTPCDGCTVENGYLKQGTRARMSVGLFGGRTFNIFSTSVTHKGKSAFLCVFVDITQLIEMENKLVEKNKELNTFLYRTSHDMRSPVASILGLINVFRPELKEPVAIQCADYVEQSAKRMDTILKDLLHVIQISGDELKIENINFTDIVNDLVGSMKFASGFRKVDVSVADHSTKPFYSDVIMIYSILQNLIDNGVKYSNPDMEQPYVKVEAKDYRDGIRLTVSDNGIGMSEEVQQRAFEMFYRGHEDSKGTGLGLYIVKSATDKLNGTIQIESKKYEGTTVSIFLPVGHHDKDFRKR